MQVIHEGVYAYYRCELCEAMNPLMNVECRVCGLNAIEAADVRVCIENDLKLFPETQAAIDDQTAYDDYWANKEIMGG